MSNKCPIFGEVSLAVVFFLISLGFVPASAQTTPSDTRPRSLASPSDDLANDSVEKQPQVGSPEANAKAKKLYKTGVQYGNAGLFTQAAEVFRQVVSLKPDHWEAYRSLGHAYIDLNQGEEAVEALENGEAFVLWKADPARPAPSRPRVRILALGRRRAVLEQIGGRVELSPRHSEILTLLALHPDGLDSEELAAEIHGTDVKAVTIRAEMSRLRRRLGCLLVGAPYRLVADVDADFLEVERLLRAGDVRAAARRHIGPLLPRSTVPGIVAARERLERGLRPAALVAPPRRRSPAANVAADGRLRLDETRRALAGLAPGAGPGRHAGRTRGSAAPPRA